MGGQFTEKSHYLLGCDRAFTSWALLEELYFRRFVDPLLFVACANQNGPHQREVAIDRRFARRFEFLGFDGIDHIEGDLIKHQCSQEWIQPAKLPHIFLVRDLLRRFGEPSDHRFLPCATRLDAEPLLLPQRRFQLVVALLGLRFVFSPSAVLYSSSAVANLDRPMR
jgi:hypothetical protein